jgi:hypothetical protein
MEVFMVVLKVSPPSAEVLRLEVPRVLLAPPRGRLRKVKFTGLTQNSQVDPAV